MLCSVMLSYFFVLSCAWRLHSFARPYGRALVFSNVVLFPDVSYVSLKCPLMLWSVFCWSSTLLKRHALSCFLLICQVMLFHVMLFPVRTHALGEAPGGASVAVFFLVLFAGYLSCPNIWCHDLRFHFLGLFQTAPSKAYSVLLWSVLFYPGLNYILCAGL